MTPLNQHKELDEAMERAHDSWAGRPYPVGPGVSQEFARAVQDRTTLAAEVTRLVEQLEAAEIRLERITTEANTLSERLDAREALLTDAIAILQWATSAPVAELWRNQEDVDRVRSLLGASSPAIEPMPEKKWPAEYINGKWEPQCPYGDWCSRCDAIGYCERVASSPAKERS